MTYYHKYNIYTGKEFDNDLTLSELDFESGKYAQQVQNFIENLKKNNTFVGEVIHESNDLTPAELQHITNEYDLTVFNKILTDPYEKNLDLTEHKLIVKKEIQGYEDLSPDEQLKKMDELSKQIQKDIYEGLEKIPGMAHFTYGESTNLGGILKHDRWAFKELAKEKEIALLENSKTNHIKQKKFEVAYDEAVELNQEPTSENLPLNFMKDVIKEHGTDTMAFSQAVSAVTSAEGETPYFMAKLMQDTLNTDEYKEAFEKEQGQSKTTENTK